MYLVFFDNAAHFSYNKFKQCDIVYLAGNNLFIEKVEVVVTMADLSRSDLWKDKAGRMSVKAVFILRKMKPRHQLGNETYSSTFQKTKEPDWNLFGHHCRNHRLSYAAG